jgi:hypothetical protein
VCRLFAEKEVHEMKNLVEGIQDECKRCCTLVGHYEKIGPVGVFGKAMIEADIREGESALASGDVVRMIQAFAALKGCE